MNECKLCHHRALLRDSHVIPAFVVRWIKETSASPYLRGAEDPNLRKQDIGTTKLLCQECETLFSQDEGEFADKIFTPYVSTELDNTGCRRGLIKEFDYNRWLLRFALSIQWRVLVTLPNKVHDEATLAEVEEVWRQFLLGNRKDSGLWENHMIFLSSLRGAAIGEAVKLGRGVNMYLLHSVDGTTVASDNRRLLGVFSKIGPIAFYTSIKPRSLKGNSDSRLHMQGLIKAAPSLNNGWLNEFIFKTRPDDIYREISEKQQGKLRDAILSNSDRAKKSMSFHLIEADRDLEQRQFGA